MKTIQIKSRRDWMNLDENNTEVGHNALHQLSFDISFPTDPTPALYPINR